MVTVGLAVAAAQEHLVAFMVHHPVTGHCLGIFIILTLLLLFQGEFILSDGPRIQCWLGKVAELTFDLPHWHPIRSAFADSNKSAPGSCFTAYFGSGLEIRFLARFHFSPNFV